MAAPLYVLDLPGRDRPQDEAIVVLSTTEYSRRLRAGIYKALDVGERDYAITVSPDLGTVQVEIRDVRDGVDAFGLGKPLWALSLEDCRDNNIQEKATEAADVFRPYVAGEPPAPLSR